MKPVLPVQLQDHSDFKDGLSYEMFKLLSVNEVLNGLYNQNLSLSIVSATGEHGKFALGSKNFW